MSDEVRRLLARLPRAQVLPAPQGFVTVFRDYVPEEHRDEADAFVVAAGGRIEQAPRHDSPTMGVGIPPSAELAAGEKYYVIPTAALAP